MKVYKTILAFILASIGALGADAQQWNPAPTEQLKMSEYPGGLSSVELIGELTINRNCTEFVTLEKNGSVVKRIPASNKLAVYPFEDDMKFANDIPASLHVTFWEDIKTSPFKSTGTYTVTFPEGFFFMPDGAPNKRMSASWHIDNVSMEFTPASGTVLNELKNIKIDFPGAEEVEVIGDLTLSFQPGNLSVGVEFPDVKVSPVAEGNTATVIIPQDFLETIHGYSGVVTVACEAGAFNVYYNGEEAPCATESFTATYRINFLSGDQNVGYTIEPYNKTVYEMQSFMVCDNFTCDTNLSRQCYFILYPPEGKKIELVAKANGYIYEVIDGIRQKTPLKYFTGQKYNVIKDGAIMFYLAGEPSTPGTIRLAPGHYQFVISQNADYTNHNPELAYEFTVVANPNAAPVSAVVMPATDSPLSILDKISVAFTDGKEVTVKKGTYATITMDNIEYTAEVSLNEEEDAPTIEIVPFSPLTMQGVYNVAVSSSKVTVDGLPYSLNLKYEVDGSGHTTGVGDINLNSEIDIYSIQGNVIARKVSPETLRTLLPGLYIVNGRKVLIR